MNFQVVFLFLFDGRRVFIVGIDRLLSRDLPTSYELNLIEIRCEVLVQFWLKTGDDGAGVEFFQNRQD
jgi:hypothetical protein